MTFEEFFNKKKIDLVQLKAAEPVLFTEFEAHYAAMGEKSFDHTKKYWFNNLRRLYHTAEEIKVEKVHIENRIAEQTVIDAVTNTVPEVSAPTLGFKPKFRAGVTATATQTPAPLVEEVKPVEPTEETIPAPKLGFKPKFRAGVTTSVNPAPAEDVKPIEPIEEPAIAPKLGFKPKFKAGVTKPAETAPPVVEEIKTEEPQADAVPAPPKLGFKPKFKAGVTKPKTENGE